MCIAVMKWGDKQSGEGTDRDKCHVAMSSLAVRMLWP